MSRIQKILMGLTLTALMLVAFIAFHLQTHAIVTTREVVPIDEQQQIKIASDLAVNIVKSLKTSYAARGVHAKGHACVKAYFEVDPDINPALRHGVFKIPGQQYKAWIRFSNSSSNMAKSDDRAKDARGIAIKLLNIGENLNGGNTQEFIAHNSPAFFTKDVRDYNRFVAEKGNPTYFLQGYNPFKWRLRELWQLYTAYSPPPQSLLWTQYFSNTAYQFGPHNIKFMMQSCTQPRNEKPKKVNDPDYLKNKLVKQLAEDSACMQFAIQLQDAAKAMPIEDATVLWQTADSPFIPLAKIIIPSQAFDSAEQRQFCEDLSFSPWNALAEHRPIGALNRARKWVYQASSDYRHRVNQTQIPQNLDW